MDGARVGANTVLQNSVVGAGGEHRGELQPEGLSGWTWGGGGPGDEDFGEGRGVSRLEGVETDVWMGR